jgi:hypothetical protein
MGGLQVLRSVGFPVTILHLLTSVQMRVWNPAAGQGVGENVVHEKLDVHPSFTVFPALPLMFKKP